MTDVVFVVLAIALFAVSAGYIGACERLTGTQDRIVGPTPTKRAAGRMRRTGTRTSDTSHGGQS